MTDVFGKKFVGSAKKLGVLRNRAAFGAKICDPIDKLAFI